MRWSEFSRVRPEEAADWLAGEREGQLPSPAQVVFSRGRGAFYATDGTTRWRHWFGAVDWHEIPAKSENTDLPQGVEPSSA